MPGGHRGISDGGDRHMSEGGPGTREASTLAAEAAGAAAGADPLQHRQPARRRAPAQEYLLAHPLRRRLSVRAARRRARAPQPRGAADASPLRPPAPARRCATSGTSTPCSPTPASGATTRGRATLAEGCIWGRGALDMKSQVAAEVAAAASLARSGWRPARGELLIVAVVDEETGGELGAEWITADPSRQGPLRSARQRGRRRACSSMAAGASYGVCCAEKGVFRFTVTTDGRRRPRLDAEGRARTRC